MIKDTPTEKPCWPRSIVCTRSISVVDDEKEKKKTFITVDSISWCLAWYLFDPGLKRARALDSQKVIYNPPKKKKIMIIKRALHTGKITTVSVGVRKKKK